jgi:hypothetical protein
VADRTTPAQTRGANLATVGGIALVAAGMLYLALGVIFVTAGQRPADTGELLPALATNDDLIRVAAALFLVMYGCYMVAFPALAVTLAGMGRTWSLVAAVAALAAILVDVISSLLVYSLPDLAHAHASASADTRFSHTLHADLAFGYIWQTETPFHVAVVSLAIFIFAAAMWNTPFDNVTAVNGMAVGGIGCVVALLGFFPIAIMWPLWLIPTGIKLFRLQRRHPSVPATAQRS